MKRAVLIAALLLTACRTGEPAPESETATPAPDPMPRSGDVERCVNALGTSNSVHDHIAECRHLWLEQGCRDAWAEALQTPPGNRGEYVIRACVQAYCPGLSSPRPALCVREDLAEADLLDEEPDWLALWTEFNAVVLNRDLQLDPDDQAGAKIARRLLQQVAISTEPSSE